MHELVCLDRIFLRAEDSILPFPLTYVCLYLLYVVNPILIGATVTASKSTRHSKVLLTKKTANHDDPFAVKN